MRFLRRIRFFGLLGFGLLAAPAGLPAKAQPFVRTANTTLQLPQDPVFEGYGLTRAFGDLTFEEPVAIATPPGETNRLFVVERQGRIMVITNLVAPDKTVFLDLSSNIYSGYLEAGLLGLAFHPGYATNGYFYLYRTLITSTEGATNTLHDELSRFEVSPINPNVALTNSELRILSQRDSNNSHNGGDIHFGPDAYLYLSLGEEVPPPEGISGNPQPIDKNFHGAILRIDVDKRPGSLPPNLHPAVTTNYAIPPDNPFVGVTNYQGVTVNPSEVRTEFYALGFRNPWKISFDPVNSDLFCGDVGDYRIEEVNVVVKGGNYGWPYLEGALPTSHFSSAPAGFASLFPFVAYEHGNATNQGKCVIGGLVYRGNQIPQLYGAYLFADLALGHVRAARWDGTNNLPPLERLTADPGISAFGRDPRDGEIILVNYREGVLKRLIFTPPAAAGSFPQTLADTGVFSYLVSLLPQAGIVPYEINVPFWSDNAIKSRWFSVPDTNLTIGFSAEGNWAFPTGTVWIKHFELELTTGDPESRRRLETRLLVKNSNGVYGVTYRWGDSVTNATLVPEAGLDESFAINDGGIIRTQVWRYPSRAECLACHTPVGGYALGFNGPQLNRDIARNGEMENQILGLGNAGYFQTNLTDISSLRVLAHATNGTAPIQDRVRSYLSANCSQCHQPGGLPHTTVTWDARLTTPLAEAGIVNGYLVSPNSPASSWMFHRISVQDTTRMPPIGSTVLDTNAAALLGEWITTLPANPWQYGDIGAVGREGSSSQTGGVFTVSGSGSGIGGEADEFHYLSVPFADNGQVIVRLISQQNTDPLARAGVMVRAAISSNAPFAMMSLTAEGGAVLQTRNESGETTEATEEAGVSGPHWLKLIREGAVFIGYHSSDGSNWVEVDSREIDMADPVWAGLAVSAHKNTAVNMAVFDNVTAMTVALSSAAPSNAWTAPAHVPLTATINAIGSAVQKVEFFAGFGKIGEMTNAPYNFLWANAPVGMHAISARATDASGSMVASQPVSVIVQSPVAVAAFALSDESTRGNWQDVYGGEGYILINDATNRPPFFQVTPTGHESFTWTASTSDERALQKVTAPTHYIAAAWFASSSLTLDVNLLDGNLHRLAIYFLDWDANDGRQQTVEVLDAGSNVVLDSRTVSTFSNGKYLVWNLRGHVKIRLTGTGIGNVVLSGLFLDTHQNNPPEVELTSPAGGSRFVVPTNIVISAGADDSDGGVRRVEFYANGLILGEATNAPYTLNWSNVLAGEYDLSARAFDVLGEEGVSAPVSISVTLPPTSVAFVGIDAATQGNWVGLYGSNGYNIIGHATNYPGYAQVSEEGANFYVWANPVSEPPALEYVNDTNRLAATWFSQTNFTVEIRLRDGKPRRLALYFLDWDSSGRHQIIEILDAATGALLNSQEVSGFPGGKYLIWSVRGHVKIRVSMLQGNAVLSGLFLDPEPSAGLPPSVNVVGPPGGAAFTVPTNITMNVEASDADGTVSKVEIFANAVKLAELTNAPYQFVWASPLAGSYTVAATATDDEGTTAASPPVQITLGLPQAGAAFVGMDEETRGNWIGRYGAEGFHVVNHAADQPDYARVIPYVPNNTTWESFASQERALQHVIGEGRIAAAWHSDSEFTVHLELADGQWHKVAWYCLDWEGDNRGQSITILDATNNTVIDSRSLSNFSGGKYLVWNLRGHVIARIVSTNAYAAISGIFYDPAVNQAPHLNAISNLTTNEDAGLQVMALSGISAGPVEEGGQALTVTATSSNPALVPEAAISYVNGESNGSLSFTPVANASGTATITVVVSDDGGTVGGGVDAVTNSFTVTINAVNDAPTLGPISNVTTNEDAGLQVMAWSGISAGPIGESGQTLTVSATSSNPAFVPDPAISYVNGEAGGSLSFTPAANASGTATITVVVSDDGGTVGGGVDAVTNSFTVTINAVNDAPTLGPISNLTTNEDAGLQVMALSGISAGPIEESGQAVTVSATSSNPALVPDPAVGYVNGESNGSLSFTPVANASGTATIMVVVSDDGGTVGGGVDAVTNSFTVTVIPRPATPASAQFVAADDETKGNWIGVYGAEGYNVVLHVTNYPGYAQVSVIDALASIWIDPVADPRALQYVAGPDRIAAAMHSDEEYRIDLDLVDGNPHQVALYCLDWDSGGRVQTIIVSDAYDNHLLDSQSVSNFSGGRYLTWNMQGHVTIRMSGTAGSKSVLSGLFFDHSLTPIEIWKAARFTPSQRANPSVSGDDADPEGDGIRILMEYALGLEPWEFETAGLPFARIVDGYFTFTYTRAKAATDVSLVVQVSGDLLTWNSGPTYVEEIEVLDNGSTENVTVRSLVPVSSATQGFMRLRVLHE